MLFDLSSGKRKRVVQVVYAFLALLIGGGLVLFGIGGAQGGILDALGIGGGDSGSSNPQYDEQISAAEDKLETNPNDQAALIELVRDHFLSATTGEGVVTDPQTGQTSISGDAHTELEQSADAWGRYLDTDPKRVNTSVASIATQTFQLLNDAEGAAEAQKYVADAQNSSTAYAQLAFFLYADLDFKAGDAAAEKAVELADPSQRKGIQQNLESYADQAHKLQKQLAKQQKQGGGGEQAQQELQDPFGALGGSSAVPTTPAP